jgi:hypothetical protein
VNNFEVLIDGEMRVIPYRIYELPLSEAELASLSVAEQLQAYCDFTRHHSGYVRGQFLQKIINAADGLVIPYIIQICSEYVVELLRIVYKNREKLNSENLCSFIIGNQGYYEKSRRRMISYWDCYYRWAYPKLQDYVGYKLFEYFDQVCQKPFNISVDADAARRSP